MLVIIANREDADQSASEKESDQGLHYLSESFGRQECSKFWNIYHK